MYLWCPVAYPLGFCEEASCSIMSFMATKKDRNVDRHKPRRMAGIKEVLARQVDHLCARNATDFTEEVNRAVREMLVREGLWPPAKADT